MRKTVCVDLDGTLLHHEKWVGLDHFGEPFDGAVDFTKKLCAFADVVIYTTRSSVEVNRKELERGPFADRNLDLPCVHNDAVEYLRSLIQKELNFWGFSYQKIWTGQGKPLCAAFVDDRGCNPYWGANRHRIDNKVLKERNYQETLRWLRICCEVK